MSMPPGFENTMPGRAPRQGALSGHRVGNFTVQGLIGEGAMGSVYLGLHETLNRQVAIKVLKPELAANEVLVNRFIDEARAASQIGHPGLVSIFDFGVLPDGQRYSVMEFLHGRDLEEALGQEGPQAIGRVAAIGAEVASALSAAHSKGIVHRDLKPANLFLSRDEDGERVKVLDFGIAKLLAGGDTARTQAGHIVGTPEYMAPEQAQARSNIDHRADIYALGCVLYELLIGHPPHTGDNIPSILVAQLQDEAVRPSQLRRDVPPGLEAIVLRCLSKRAEDRFQTMEQVRAALLPYVDSSIAAPPQRQSRALPPPTYPSMVAPNRGRSWLIAISALLAIGAALVIFFVVKGAKDDSSGQGTNLATNGAGSGEEQAAAPDANHGTHTTGNPATEVDDKNPFNLDNASATAGGKAIYNKECSKCHGDTGAGDGASADPMAPPKSFIKGTDMAALDVFRFQTIRRGNEDETMPAFGTKLSKTETWQVVTFLRTLSADKRDFDEGLDTSQPKTTPELVKQGAAVFKRECKSCHGNDGRGRGAAAEFLPKKPADLTNGFYKLRSTPKDSIPTDDDIFRTVSRGVGTGVMPGFPRLDPQERWAVVAYTKSLSKRFAKEKPGKVTTAPPRTPSTAMSIARGKKLFETNGCFKCHGANADGVDAEITNLTDKRGNKLEVPTFSDQYDFLSGTAPEDVWRTMYNGLAGVRMPMGRTVMSEDQAWDVINWIVSLQKRE